MKVAGADAPFEIVWDKSGFPHVYAETVADAYRGMGYAAGSERLWQIHLSTAYALGEAAELLGERFVAQDTIQRACNVHGDRTGLVQSSGDWIARAYLEGLNAVVDSLDEIPPEFVCAGATPRKFTLRDIAARYRFTSWFQHKSWTEKMLLGRLMATHGVDMFRHHVLHFSDTDKKLIGELQADLAGLSTGPFALAYPEASAALTSGSNNWAVTGARSVSGKPILATDPHQPHSIPNTFFYVHLHAPGFDVFGAAFPGVPYFMMGTTQDIAWGLTTGFIDCYDVYIERLRNGTYQSDGEWHPLALHSEHIGIKGGQTRKIQIQSTPHGPLLEPLCRELGIMDGISDQTASALYWSLTSVPTSAGALAQLPLAASAEEFGHLLFEDDVCPLVNNIICVDRANGLRRFIATTTPARYGATGSVPLPGWDSDYNFRLSTERELTVEVDPDRGYALTANNDTMGDSGPFYIHNFPTHSARADRIEQILASKEKFGTDDFQRAQLDLKDLRAETLLPDLIYILEQGESVQLKLATQILSAWDCNASAQAAAPCIFYPFQDRLWARKFMLRVLDDPALNAIGPAAPGLNLFDIGRFLSPGNPWSVHRDELIATIHETMTSVVDSLIAELGEDIDQWQWGKIHQVQFSHRLHREAAWQGMSVGPDPVGGSATTLAMAAHMGPGPGQTGAEEIPCRVYHGPAFRMVVDLAAPGHIQFVVAGGNGGQAGSEYANNQYETWLQGEYLTVSFSRDELDVERTWQLGPES